MAATDDNPPTRKPRWYPLGPMPPEESKVPLWWSDPTVVILPGFMFAAIVLALIWALMQPVVSEFNASIKVFNLDSNKAVRGEAEEPIRAMVPGKSYRLAFEPADKPQVAFQIDETGIQRIERIDPGERPKLTVVTNATGGDVYIVIVAKKSMQKVHDTVDHDTTDLDTVERWFGLPSRQKELVEGLQGMASSTNVPSEAKIQRRAADALKLLDATIQAAGNRGYSRSAACLSVVAQED